jgi:hypothetical protein
MRKPNLTPARRARLIQLADFLDTLPKRTRKFNMRLWFDDKKNTFNEGDYIKAPTEIMHNCGTAACALGWAPAAGLTVPPRYIFTTYLGLSGVNWFDFAKDFVGDRNLAHSWCFSGNWTTIDNTPHGAAARIRYLLHRGDVPANFDGNPRRLHREIYERFRK